MEDVAKAKEIIARDATIPPPMTPIGSPLASPAALAFGTQATANRAHLFHGAANAFGQMGSDQGPPVPTFGQTQSNMAVPPFANGLGHAASFVFPTDVLPSLGGIPQGEIVDCDQEPGIMFFYPVCFVGPDFYVRQKSKSCSRQTSINLS